MNPVCRFVVPLLLGALGVTPVYGVTEVCIFIGAPGDPTLESRFHGWASRLTGALTGGYGLEKSRVSTYPAAPGDGALTREMVAGAFGELSTRMTADDALLVVLIGHGSDQDVPKFMLEGPDATAADFRSWLDGVPTGTQLVLDTTSASGGFIGYLAGPNRAVCTGTAGGTERNAPEFMEHVVLALEEGRGDVDKNGRLSWTEWVNAAARGTADWYEKEGLLSTEHALLDDDGDGQGTRLPASDTTSGDGVFGSEQFVNGVHQAGVPEGSPYAEAIAAVEAWKAERERVPPSEYWDTLEKLLLDAARSYPSHAAAP